ncbi:MAG TPA: glycosyltransferase family 39 protein [Candidatus Hydrogenedens sp.]|nr:glycosyltransferase family 39 protein [Candidatus Hydrogenedens sp.]
MDIKRGGYCFISFFKSKYFFVLLLILIILFAFTVRYMYTKRGFPYLHNVDEPKIGSTALRMLKTGDLNPHFFNYGSLLIYINFLSDIVHYFYLMGQPESAESYLTSLNDIKINMDTGWPFTLSHPSFYHWGRVIIAIFGTLTVFVTFLTTKYIFNKWVGLLSALFLAALDIHVKNVYLMPNIPVAFFVMITTLFSIIFIKNKQTKYFIISLICVGLTIATKYNAGLIIIVPLIALVIVRFQRKDVVKPYLWYLIPVIPAITFLIVMPYAFLDIKTFLEHVGFEIRHYKVTGHVVFNKVLEKSTSQPGWDNMIFQFSEFHNNLGTINLIIIALGIIGIFKPTMFFTFIMPLFYFYFMTKMKVNLHQNFILFYPFFSILFASGVYFIYLFLRFLENYFFHKHKINFSLCLVSIIFTIYLLNLSYDRFAVSKKIYYSKDTRTQIVDFINNKMKNINKVYFAEELRMHEQDLRKIKVKQEVVPLEELIKIKDSKSIFVVPTNIVAEKDVFKEKANKLSKIISLIENSLIENSLQKSDMIRLGGKRELYIDILSVNPGIYILKKMPTIEAIDKK